MHQEGSGGTGSPLMASAYDPKCKVCGKNQLGVLAQASLSSLRT